jgi:hypothetical protein
VPYFLRLVYFIDTPLGSVFFNVQNNYIKYSVESELYPKQSNVQIASASFDSATSTLTLVSTSIPSNPWNNNTYMPVVFTKFFDN